MAAVHGRHLPIKRCDGWGVDHLSTGLVGVKRVNLRSVERESCHVRWQITIFYDRALPVPGGPIWYVLMSVLTIEVAAVVIVVVVVVVIVVVVVVVVVVAVVATRTMVA